MRDATNQTPALSPTMQSVVQMVRDNGAIVRYHGGFWARPDWNKSRPWYGTSTVEALVTRGVLVYTEWKGSGTSSFPIRAELRIRSEGSGNG